MCTMVDIRNFRLSKLFTREQIFVISALLSMQAEVIADCTKLQEGGTHLYVVMLEECSILKVR